MKTLNEKNWAPTPITAIFNLLRGREGNMAMLKDGDIPLVSAKNGSNGLKGFVNTPKSIVSGHCISLNNDGDGGAGLAYYQPADMALDTHVTALLPKYERQSKESMQFIAECASSLHGFFGHGLSISNKRAEKIKIMLPTDDNCEPDYEYMERYVTDTREALLARYRTYVEKQIARLEYRDVPALDEKEWKSFCLGNFGDVLSGRDIYAQERTEGGTPYITSGSTNNGIGYFVSNVNETIDSGYVSFNRNGAVGQAFYHPYKSLLGNDCRKIHIKHADGNLFVGQFFGLCISKQKVCYSYSRKLGTARAQKMQIMLPVTDAGEPDYGYMEQYTKNMMLRKYEQYLEFLDKQGYD